eukprot:TRINITY_DN3518_c0_g1_i1.p1 TRINITY_DN3518_c0_g1~~TRINITY_DN3518_c0_g1_i1.p1  ORF type:complete len:641 (-),score=164.46 TRINITY_DN3518_c0_g1_i1:161-1867(-)
MPDFDDEKDVSLYGVFDGHGGKGVSKFAVVHLPQLLKDTEAYKRGDFKTALEEAFLEVDVRLRSPEGRAEVKELDRADPKKKVQPILLSKAVVQRFMSQSAGDGDAEVEFGDDDEDTEPQETPPAEGEVLAGAEDKITEERQKTLKKEQDSTAVELAGKVEAAEVKNGKDLEGAAGTADATVGLDTKSASTVAPVAADINGDESPSLANAGAPQDSPAKNIAEAGKVVPGGEGGANTEASGEAADFGDDDDDGSDNVRALVEEDLEEELDAHDEEDDDEFAVEGEDDLVAVNPAVIRESTPEAQGCTAVVVMVVRSREGDGPRLICANAGDSRAIVSRRGAVVALSEDHKPECALEVDRIKKAGGYVQMDTPGGPRVMGDLNLSRAFGDTRYKTNEKVPAKDQIVTAFPEVRTLPLTDDDEFIVIGCDGIWECLSNQEAVDFVRPHLLEREDGSKPEALSRTCAAICDRGLCPSMDTTENPSFDGHGCDNMTVAIVRLKERIRGEVDDDAKTAAREAEKRAADAALANPPPAKKPKMDSSPEKSTGVELEMEFNGVAAAVSAGDAQAA